MNLQVALLGAAALLAITGAALLSRRRTGAGRALAAAALAVLLALISYRWWLTGHPPLFGTLESDVADGAALLVAALWLSRRAAPFVTAGAAALGGALPLRGLAHGLNMFPLTISERSLWIDLHAPLGYAAFACLAVAALEAGRLVVSRAQEEETGRLSASLLWGFLFVTALMVTGIWYSGILFGAFWRWDPVESLALAAWLSLGTLAHARLFFGWSERRIAGWVLAAFALALVLFKGLVYLPGGATYHVFDLRL